MFAKQYHIESLRIIRMAGNGSQGCPCEKHFASFCRYVPAFNSHPAENAVSPDTPILAVLQAGEPAPGCLRGSCWTTGMTVCLQKQYVQGC
ncbi:hypothetical protein CNY67_09940 [Desulfovibrio sp. G11]|nr:hypothetical protein CNY67_09940 [Desulfovibrio sp. G11]